MTGTQTLIARAGLGVIAGTAGLVAVSSARLRSLPSAQFDRLAIWALILSRLGLFAGLFFLLRTPPRGDVPAFYWDEATRVLQGLLPYRDVASSYAPLHTYFDGFLIRLWPNPLAIMLVSLMAEFFLLPIWLRIGRRFLAEQELRTGTLLYLTSVLSLQFVAIDGQDNIIIAVLLALALLLLVADRPIRSGSMVGIGAVFIKFLPLLYAPLFFFATPRRWRWLAGLALPTVLVYGACVVKGLPILMPLTLEGALKSANDLPFLVESIFGIVIPSFLSTGIMAAMLLLIFVLVAQAIRQSPSHLRLRPVIFGMAALTLATVLFSKKSWPPYLILALFPICLLIPTASRLKSAAFALFGIVAIIAPSYWATIFKQFSSAEFHQGLVAHQPGCLLFLALQTLLVAGYAWLLAVAIRRIIDSPRTKISTEILSSPQST